MKLSEENKEKTVVLGPYHHCLTHTEADTVGLLRLALRWKTRQVGFEENWLSWETRLYINLSSPMRVSGDA